MENVRKLVLLKVIFLLNVGLATMLCAQTSQSTDVHRGMPADLEPGEVGHYGAPFLLDQEPLGLAEAIAEHADSGVPCRVEAQVDTSCQRSGCWITLVGEGYEGSPVRVRMLDYGFFVPANASMSTAVIEGVINSTEISQEMAQHYADDEAAATGQPPREVTGPEREYTITATAIQLTRTEQQ